MSSAMQRFMGLSWVENQGQMLQQREGKFETQPDSKSPDSGWSNTEATLAAKLDCYFLVLALLIHFLQELGMW